VEPLFVELSLEQCISLACLLEVTAPKVGNVHRGADFEDACFLDFAVSGIVAAPALAGAASGVGNAVLQAVSATQQAAGTNTNLGIALLLAPLAAADPSQPGGLQAGVQTVLNQLTAEDSRLTYEAIRLAAPGGLGDTSEMDVAGAAPPHLLDAMRAAASRDIVAQQYAEGYPHVFREGAPAILSGVQNKLPVTAAIAHAHVQLMAKFPDTLIARKCGAETAGQSAIRAARVLEAGQPGEEYYQMALSDLDFWLRSDHHRRNPGATADIITASIFVLLRQGQLPAPWR